MRVSVASKKRLAKMYLLPYFYCFWINDYHVFIFQTFNTNFSLRNKPLELPKSAE